VFLVGLESFRHMVFKACLTITSYSIPRGLPHRSCLGSARGSILLRRSFAGSRRQRAFGRSPPWPRHRRGRYFAGAASTAIILIILAGLKPLEEAYRARNQSFQFQIKAERGRLTPEVLKRTLELRRGQVKRFIAQPTRKKGEDSIHALISQVSPQDV
jgi:hypothetical protein